MQQSELELKNITDHNLTGYELTDWSDSEPPCAGWWNTRRKDRPLALGRRRWWNGVAWSLPVKIGFDSDSEAEEIGHWLAQEEVNQQIEWQGLKRPAPFYSYIVPFSHV